VGASDQGLGLYKKYGCVEVDVMKTNLWEYYGGEGLGVITHVMLHRPASSRDSAQVIQYGEERREEVCKMIH
jgi:hypothetical protein